MTRIAIFPGQGSQKVGMGKDLFDRFPAIAATADRVLGYSIRELCLSDPQRQLGRTEFTQPALFTVNALHYMAHIADGAPVPDFVAGHSLGEYNALLVAEAFDFETGLRLVQKRGALMGAISGGGMAAILGLDAARIRAVMAQSGVSTIDVANFNSLIQTVLSGPTEDLEKLGPSFEAAGGRVFPLNVRTAFHSRYMRAMAEQFAAFLAGVRFSPLVVPVISNFTALPYRDDEIVNNLVKQLDHSVRWVESVQYLMDEPAPDFVELGPGTVLTRLVKAIGQHPTPVNIARRYWGRHARAPVHAMGRARGSRARRGGPALRGGEIRVQVASAGVNFADLLMIAGKYQENPPLPFSPGFEVAGTVDEGARDVTTWRRGDRVIGMLPFGGYAEQAVLPAERAIAMPPSLEPAAAGGFPVAYGTAYGAFA